MQFRSLLAFSLALLNFCPLSLNDGQYVPVISGGGKDISFLQCTSIIDKAGGVYSNLEACIDNGIESITTSMSFYAVNTDNLDCLISDVYMSLCYKEESQRTVATVSITYLINVPKTFLYACEVTFRFTTGETKKLALEKNITNDERIASSSIRCRGHGWCKNQPGGANYFSNKPCCNPAICFASRSARWHEPLCCYFIARKQVSSDFNTRMVVKKDTFFLALSLLASFTVCSVILGILQIKAMGVLGNHICFRCGIFVQVYLLQGSLEIATIIVLLAGALMVKEHPGQRKQLKKKEESKRQRRLIDELKAVQTLQRVLDE